MDKLDELKKMKELFDSGMISKEELNILKVDLLSSDEIPNKNLNLSSKNSDIQKPNGVLKITYKQMFFLFYPNYSLKIDGVNLPHINIGKNYAVEIPIKKNNYDFKIEYSLFGIFKSKTDIHINNLDLYKNYIVEITYDRYAGSFSDKYTIYEF